MAIKKPIKKKSKRAKPSFILLHESTNPEIDKFLALYEKNPHHARVKFFNDRNSYIRTRLVLFEHANGDFDIVRFDRTFGISVTNRLYSRESKGPSILYRSGKFYCTNINVRRGGSNIQTLTVGSLYTFTGIVGCNDEIFRYLNKKFHWFKTVIEHPLKKYIAFDNIVKHKLFGSKEISRYILKVPNNICDIVIKNQIGLQESVYNAWRKTIRNPWLEKLKVLDGVQNITAEFINSPYFNDTCRMAMIIGKKVNCRWGLKRLKEEHDNWSREINNIMLSDIDEYDLRISLPYKAFGEYSGFKLLQTNKEMLAEGMNQNHCVGTYINKVELGDCGIYHVDGYTLQLSIVDMNKSLLVTPYDASHSEKKYKLEVTQFKGKHNCDAPKVLVDRVKDMINSFNLDAIWEDFKLEKNNAQTMVAGGWNEIDQHDGGLPF